MIRIVLLFSLLFTVNIASAQKKSKVAEIQRAPQPVSEMDEVEEAKLRSPQAYSGHCNLPMKNGRVKRHMIYQLRGEMDGYFFIDSMVVSVTMPQDETLQLRISNKKGDVLLNCERKGPGKCSFGLADLPMDKVYELSFYNTSGKLMALESFIREKGPESADR